MLLLLLLSIFTATMAYDHFCQQAGRSFKNVLTPDFKTTASPFLRPDLVRRDSQQLLMAPDYTCGYVDGRAGKYLRCARVSLLCSLSTQAPLLPVRIMEIASFLVEQLGVVLVALRPSAPTTTSVSTMLRSTLPRHALKGVKWILTL